MMPLKITEVSLGSSKLSDILLAEMLMPVAVCPVSPVHLCRMKFISAIDAAETYAHNII